ncbi:PREDICTED: zinc finger BED domain-containing protein RICESLEEPER 2-like [Camelina sativa]|uniref:Zinc finger BED domain-containing protein RICESLEEPER 2-like n=1 Tax=Camelina sativa TaxID=90675 RepID=A0ABM1RAE2_CAMSA|nr:PREDICTED: zinc finger BED domain-containing protein RICESLEEPER 2-like [Camelina sativa]
MNLIVRDGLHEMKGKITAIRNAIQYVRSNTKRCESFEQKVVSGKMTRGSLPLDVKTRWNSTYLMLSRALKFRAAFDKMEMEDKLYNDFFLEVVDGEKRIGPPQFADWNAVERLVKFLAIFYKSTLVLSASASVASYKCYGEIVTIEKSLMVLSTSLDKDLRTKADEMIAKFEKYWDGMKHINKMLIVASVFDPRKKMQFANMCFEKLYGKESSEVAEMNESVTDVLKALFKEYSGVHNKGIDNQSSQSNPTSTVGGREYNDATHTTHVLDDDVGYEVPESMDYAYPRDELEIYLKEKVENPKTIMGTEWYVLSWWKVNNSKYPVLAEIAKDVLAMQVSSVASESAFSTSGRIIEPHRSCLSHYMVEVLMCTEQWLKCELNSSDKTFTNAQLLADIEMFDTLQRKFDGEVN